MQALSRHGQRWSLARFPGCDGRAGGQRLADHNGQLNFSKEATREATRDGAPTIDLIDGDQLFEKLRELESGVRTKKVEVEHVIVDRDWILGI